MDDAEVIGVYITESKPPNENNFRFDGYPTHAIVKKPYPGTDGAIHLEIGISPDPIAASEFGYRGVGPTDTSYKVDIVLSQETATQIANMLVAACATDTTSADFNASVFRGHRQS
jgi:hypothetical protein